jgi:hypothetical protein
MLKLILPVLFPSWRFFSAIGASPRLQIALLKTADEQPNLWREFRPRPARISLAQGLLRLLHNPQWNESLYLNSCAERIFEGASPFYQREILERIDQALAKGELPVGDARFWCYRLLALESDLGAVTEIQVLVSEPRPIALRASSGN